MNKIVRVMKMSNRDQEDFDSKKLQKSIDSACLSINLPKGESRQISNLVVHDVNKWLNNKEVITSRDVRQAAYEKLLIYQPDAAYIYKQYKNII